MVDEAEGRQCAVIGRGSEKAEGRQCAVIGRGSEKAERPVSD
jgi:hypothetical protein